MKERLVVADTHKRNILDELRREGVEVELPANWDAMPGPQSLMYEGFEGALASVWKAVDRLTESCQEYVSGVIMRDHFGNDHEARRLWRREMTKQYGEAFKNLDGNNKLRLNFIGNLQSRFEFLVYQLDQDNIHTQEAEEVRKLGAAFPKISSEAYGAMSDEEKLAVVKKVHDIASTFLLLVKPGVDTA